jgi:hypothetical protein
VNGAAGHHQCEAIESQNMLKQTDEMVLPDRLVRRFIDRVYCN